MDDLAKYIKEAHEAADILTHQKTPLEIQAYSVSEELSSRDRIALFLSSQTVLKPNDNQSQQQQSKLKNLPNSPTKTLTSPVSPSKLTTEFPILSVQRQSALRLLQSLCESTPQAHDEHVLLLKTHCHDMYSQFDTQCQHAIAALHENLCLGTQFVNSSSSDSSDNDSTSDASQQQQQHSPSSAAAATAIATQRTQPILRMQHEVINCVLPFILRVLDAGSAQDDDDDEDDNNNASNDNNNASPLHGRSTSLTMQQSPTTQQNDTPHQVQLHWLNLLSQLLPLLPRTIVLQQLHSWIVAHAQLTQTVVQRFTAAHLLATHIHVVASSSSNLSTDDTTQCNALLCGALSDTVLQQCQDTAATVRAQACTALASLLTELSQHAVVAATTSNQLNASASAQIAQFDQYCRPLQQCVSETMELCRDEEWSVRYAALEHALLSCVNALVNLASCTRSQQCTQLATRLAAQYVLPFVRSLLLSSHDAAAAAAAEAASSQNNSNSVSSNSHSAISLTIQQQQQQQTYALCVQRQFGPLYYALCQPPAVPLIDSETRQCCIAYYARTLQNACAHWSAHSARPQSKDALIALDSMQRLVYNLPALASLHATEYHEMIVPHLQLICQTQFATPVHLKLASAYHEFVLIVAQHESSLASSPRHSNSSGNGNNQATAAEIGHRTAMITGPVLLRLLQSEDAQVTHAMIQRLSQILEIYVTPSSPQDHSQFQQQPMQQRRSSVVLALPQLSPELSQLLLEIQRALVAHQQRTIGRQWRQQYALFQLLSERHTLILFSHCEMAQQLLADKQLQYSFDALHCSAHALHRQMCTFFVALIQYGTRLAGLALQQQRSASASNVVLSSFSGGGGVGGGGRPPVGGTTGSSNSPTHAPTSMHTLQSHSSSNSSNSGMNNNSSQMAQCCTSLHTMVWSRLQRELQQSRNSHARLLFVTYCIPLLHCAMSMKWQRRHLLLPLQTLLHDPVAVVRLRLLQHDGLVLLRQLLMSGEQQQQDAAQHDKYQALLAQCRAEAQPGSAFAHACPELLAVIESQAQSASLLSRHLSPDAQRLDEQRQAQEETVWNLSAPTTTTTAPSTTASATVNASTATSSSSSSAQSQNASLSSIEDGMRSIKGMKAKSAASAGAASAAAAAAASGKKTTDSKTSAASSSGGGGMFASALGSMKAPRGGKKGVNLAATPPGGLTPTQGSPSHSRPGSASKQRRGSTVASSEDKGRSGSNSTASVSLPRIAPPAAASPLKSVGTHKVKVSASSAFNSIMNMDKSELKSAMHSAAANERSGGTQATKAQLVDDLGLSSQLSLSSAVNPTSGKKAPLPQAAKRSITSSGAGGSSLLPKTSSSKAPALVKQLSIGASNASNDDLYHARTDSTGSADSFGLTSGKVGLMRAKPALQRPPPSASTNSSGAAGQLQSLDGLSANSFFTSSSALGSIKGTTTRRK